MVGVFPPKGRNILINVEAGSLLTGEQHWKGSQGEMSELRHKF